MGSISSILKKEGIRVCAEVPHGLVYYQEGHEDFGFVSRRILDYRIAIPPVFDDVYVFGSEDGTGGCLIWVKHEKWAVLDLDSFTLESAFIYDKIISEFKEVSVDNERHVGVYEAQAERDGVRETVEIEKYLCSSYYPY